MESLFNEAKRIFWENKLFFILVLILSFLFTVFAYLYCLDMVKDGLKQRENFDRTHKLGKFAFNIHNNTNNNNLYITYY